MSHFDEFIEFLVSKQGVARGYITQLMHMHAHELAREIRTDADEWECWPEREEGMRYAARLIDPETTP